jgi:hypothetical protein
VIGMQCSSCGFENMPGSESCGRCSTSLRLATATMDVHPPRAGKFAKRLRRVLPVRQAYYGVRDAVQGVHPPRPPLGSAILDDLPPWRLLWRLVVPGWSHFHNGQRVRGHLFLWGFVAFLLPGLMLLGTGWGSFFLGLAFSMHTSAAIDVFNHSAPRYTMGQLLARSLLVTLAFAIGLYLPSAWLLGRVAAVRTIQLTAVPFEEGDVVWVNQSLHAHDWPRPGQVVLYAIPVQRVPGGEAHRGAIYEYAGERVDRVLASSGDKVVWDEGRLIVNGVRSPLLPMNETIGVRRLALTVPHDCVFILPSTTPNLGGAAPAGVLEALSCVPREQIAGTVYFRSQPLSRMQVIR